MNKRFFTIGLLCFTLLLFYGCKTGATSSTERKLVWADEFETDGLPDSKKWSYDVGDACDRPQGCGWGNNELQYYTKAEKKNARIENGILIVEAHREKRGRSQYTSARLISKGKGDFTYGRMEIRAKLPSGKGTWGAIWMMPSEDKYGGWPRSGELDIMEYVGYDKNRVHGTPHTKAFNGMIGTQKTAFIDLQDVEEKFHNYIIEWTPNQIDWYVDDQKFNTFVKEGDDSDKWPFDQPFYMILNMAVGGNWGGSKGVDKSIWPQKMLVDYVRVYEYQKDP